MDKIVYEDGNKERILRGQIINEDDYFIDLKLTNGTVYQIAKRKIISARRGKEKNNEEGPLHVQH